MDLEKKTDSAKPKVAILLAAYNGAEYITEQLKSIENQLNVSLTVFLSLDLSNDNTLEIVNAYNKNLTIEILPYGDHYGSAGANFFRLLKDTDFSGFDYVAFADQDDIWLPEKLKNAIHFMNSAGVAGYSSNITAFWSNGKEKLIKKDHLQVDYDYLFESPGPGCTFVLNQKLANSIKVEISNKYNSIHSIWLHDWFCYSFARFKGFKWGIDSKPTMLYRQHDSNEVGANSGFKSFLKRFSVIISGNGFDKSLQQARFIGQTNVLPIDLLSDGSRFSMLKLSLISFRCRRQFIHKLFFFIICFYFSIKGYKYNND
jgi:rhamnosyltransferase